jgi:hypothetical protein
VDETALDETAAPDTARCRRRGQPRSSVNGHRELADLLRTLGAPPPHLRPTDAFVAAVLAGDADAVTRTPATVVTEVRRQRTGLVTWAAAQGAPNSVELLVGSGFDVNAPGRGDIPGNEPWHTALHVAAEHGNLALARNSWTWAPARTSPTCTIRQHRWAGPDTSTTPPWPTYSNPSPTRPDTAAARLRRLRPDPPLLGRLHALYPGFTPAPARSWANTGWSANREFNGC